MENHHILSEETVLKNLKTSRSGLSDEEAKARLEKYGENVLKEGEKRTVLGMFVDQFKNLMIVILIIAAIIAGFMNEITDSIIILVVILINAILGVLQEQKAEKALAALKKMSAPHARVIRNNSLKEIKAEEIVPGDIVLLEAGDYVPADMRLIEVAGLKIEEAALTGESVPVEKNVNVIEEADVVLGDRKNMAYSGSSVTYGRGKGVVTATGMDTEIGKIAAHLSSESAGETPLQKKITEVSKYLTIGVIIISIIIFITGIMQGRENLEMLLTAISLAVAAIPEGLPAVITIVLALGVQKMAGRNAIIRKLSAVETLGSTEIICSDKTGTLTQNKMTVKELYLEENIKILSEILVLCNDSKLINGESGGEENIIGDPTETALISFAFKKGYDVKRIKEMYRRVNEIPFDSERKLMSTLHDYNGKFRVMSKGAPDVLIARCSKINIAGKIMPLTDDLVDKILKANKAMAGKALRVLAAAYKDITSIPEQLSSETIENDLVFAGLVGMIDPPREEAKEAVEICTKAGIRPIMITGDHRDTAAAIAKELNILKSNDEIITGNELNQMDDDELADKIEKYSVYARVSPEHKVRIVKGWMKKGKVVAMTGDGVNDAPALKIAHIGVGMGITGTEVTKGVSDMVLADDNFATIVAAVGEGRKIYSNIRKSIQFLLSSNLGEIVTLFIGTMLNWVVLFPIHILWVNLVTDTLPALALGVEKAEKDIMQRPPRKSDESFFASGVGINIVYQGIIKGLITLLVYYIGLSTYGSKEVAITMTFATLGLIQLTHSLNMRSNTKSILSLGLFTNRYLIGAIIIAAILQVSVIFIPGLNELFRVTFLTSEQWLIVLAASFSIIPIVELVKKLFYAPKYNKKL